MVMPVCCALPRSTATSLRARATDAEPLRVAIVGGARCGVGHVANRLAGELCGTDGGAHAALVDARSLECADAEAESPAVRSRVKGVLDEAARPS